MQILYPNLQPVNGFDHDAVRKNLADFQARDDLQAVSQKELAAHKGHDGKVILIVCPGPSAKMPAADGSDRTELQRLADAKMHKIILAGSAVRFLYDGTLKPEQVAGVVSNHPQSELEKLIEGSEEIRGVPFYVATHADPALFDRLKAVNATIVPFNAYVEGAHDFKADEFAIGTGHGAAVGAIAVMSAMGHNHYDAIGWDGAGEYVISLDEFPDYKERLNSEETYVTIDGQIYSVFPDFAGDAIEVAALSQNYPRPMNSLHVLGNGITGRILNAPDGDMRTDFQNLSARVEAIMNGSAAGSDFDPHP